MTPIVKIVIGMLAGAGFGYLMYRVVGCSTGACPLTANPWRAMLIWGAIGALMFSGR